MRQTLLPVVLAAALIAGGSEARAQDARIGDLAITDVNVPVRVVGYGLVVGLDGTGDRAIGSFGARHTVQSVVNLLRNFGIEVPAEVLRTRNVAAVLVTAEASPFLRPGGRFEVHVASVGDASSLRGGVLWATPLVFDPGSPAVATAQGPLLLSEGEVARGGYSVETTARIPDGALLLADLPKPAVTSPSRLLLREPNIGTAVKIAEAINTAIGENSAQVEDPGAVALTLKDSAGGTAVTLAKIADLRVKRDAAATVLVDTRDGTVVVGGEVTVGPGVVSHGGLTLTVGATRTDQPAAGEVRVAPGASVQDVASALQAVGAPAPVIAAIFESLHRVGALTAEVKVRMIRPLDSLTPGLGAGGPDDDKARLRKATSQLEGVFMEQLFKAMRDTVPQDGALDGGEGEAMFTSMMDEHVAEAAAVKQHRIGDALYRQLVDKLPSQQQNPGGGQ